MGVEHPQIGVALLSPSSLLVAAASQIYVYIIHYVYLQPFRRCACALRRRFNSLFVSAANRAAA